MKKSKPGPQATPEDPTRRRAAYVVLRPDGRKQKVKKKRDERPED